MKLPSTIDTIGILGSILMAVFAFTMQPVCAIIGLALLTIQAYDKKLWNLIVLNLISIGGFAGNLI